MLYLHGSQSNHYVTLQPHLMLVVMSHIYLISLLFEMIYCIEYSQSTLLEIEHVAFHNGLWLFHTRASLLPCSL